MSGSNNDIPRTLSGIPVDARYYSPDETGFQRL